MASRREFLQTTLLTGAGLSLARAADARPFAVAPDTFVDLIRPPDSVTIRTGTGEQRLVPAGGRWRGDGVTIDIDPAEGAARVRLSAPGAAVAHVRIRWHESTDGIRLILGDAWERGYGDLEWRGIVPDRAMPWYVAAFDGAATHGYGVRTGPAAFCSWRVDQDGIALTADVRSGGAPVQLGDRVLPLCDVVSRRGEAGESPFAALRGLCVALCGAPKMPAHPVYGSNDWYYAYGKNSAASFLADAQRISELSPSGPNRPFAVVDDGWQPEREDKAQVGHWDRGNARFGDMAEVAERVRRAGTRPGIWTRPLLAATATPASWRLQRDRTFLDPTVPEALAKVAADVARVRTWGFELLKHDYTTYDLFGRWGFQMGTALTKDGWTFAEGPRRTTAEVTIELYRTIRAAAGDAAIIGCNTVSHLSAGIFDICRIGDDTSGTDWARTRKMGVNTLAFRAAHHGAFYAADADCAAVTTAVPWALERQWLDLVARSGTPLFVSIAPEAVTPDRIADLRAALARAATPQPLGEPLDWQRTVSPTRWRLDGEERGYDWIGDDRAI